MQRLAATLLILSIILTPTAQGQNSNHQSWLEKSLASAQKKIDDRGPRANTTDWTMLGDAQLRIGKTKESIKSFEKAIQLKPNMAKFLWQYGIALYLDGQYDKARTQFETVHKLLRNSGKISTWHFLCSAKATDADQARKSILPASKHSKVILEKVFQRLHTSDDSIVLDQIKSSGDAAEKLAGNLYLGMIADAEGRTDDAIRYMRIAASSTEIGYTADTARIYLDHLVKPNKAH
ncbi:tetratricopeptide repeat protein [Stieleria marina]